MTTEILGNRLLEVYIRSWTLLPSKGSKFEVTVNGQLVFSKKSLGRHAEPGEIQAAVRALLLEINPDAARILDHPELLDDD